MSHNAEKDAGLAEHEIALRSLWRELAEKRIEAGVDWPRVVLTLFADLDRLEGEVRAQAEALADEWQRIGEEGLPHLGCLDMYRHLSGELRAAITRVIPPGNGEA